MTQRVRKALPYLLAFILPIVLLFLAFQLQRGGIWPFGENTILTIDAEGQYVPFFAYLKSIIFGNNDFSYSFNNLLGGDVFAFSAYYLFSPFNIIYLIIQTETVAFLVVTLLKVGVAGLLAFIFLTRHFKQKASCKTVIFSTAYAVCLYSIAFYSNTMFIDGLVWLPLIFLGIDKLLETGKTRFYILSLAGILCAQYYMAYILCIGAVLYFSYTFLINHKNRSEIKRHLFQVRQFLISSIIAAALAAVVLLPTFLALSNTQRHVNSAASNSMAMKYISFSFTEAPLQFLGFVKSNIHTIYGPPFVFCGIVISFLVVLYFFSRRIKKREKILSAGFIFIFLISFALPPLDYIWHGFSTPNGFTFRYAFILSFFLIFLAYKAFLDMQRWRFMQNKLTIFSFGLVNTASLLTVAVLCLVNVVSDGAHELKIHDEINFNISNIRSGMRMLSEADPATYRVEKDFQYTENDPMLFGYNGLTGYNSNVQATTMKFLERLNFLKDLRISLATTYKTDFTMSIDSLFGVKYVVITPKTDIFEYDSEVLNNIYALPIGFMADKNLLSADITGLEYFELQNKIFQSLSGLDTPIFTVADLPVETNGLLPERLADGKTDYVAANKDEPGYFYVDAPADEDKLYYFDLLWDKSLGIYLNGKLKRLNPEHSMDGAIVDPPLLLTDKYDLASEGSQLEIEVPSTFSTKATSFWQESKEALGEHYLALADEPCELNKISSSHLTCTVEAFDDGNLFLSIPNDEGWTVTVDGKKVRTETAFELFMTIPLKAGVHEIEMRYVPKGLHFGIFLSVATLIGYTIFSMRKFWRQTQILFMATILKRKR